MQFNLDVIFEKNNLKGMFDNDIDIEYNVLYEWYSVQLFNVLWKVFFMNYKMV